MPASGIAHREHREAQIVGALGPVPTRVSEIVAQVYTDVPTVLHKAAELSVSSHLLKLEGEGRATRSDPREDARKAAWSVA